MQNNQGGTVRETRERQERPPIRQTRIRQQVPVQQIPTQPAAPAQQTQQRQPIPMQQTQQRQSAPSQQPQQRQPAPSQQPQQRQSASAQQAKTMQLVPVPQQPAGAPYRRALPPSSSAVIHHPGGSHASAEPKQTSPEKKKRRFYLQPLREISWPRRIVMLLFGLLFLWCAAPAFFMIRGIGVMASSAVMLAIFVAALLWHLIDEHSGVKINILRTVIALGFSACVIAFCVVSGFMLKASMTVLPEDCPDYTIVVLGCKASGTNPSWMLEDRLNKAFRVLTDHPDAMCVVTGGKGDDEDYTEAYVMKKYLTDKGISPDRILMEEAAGSTEENLLYTKTVIELNGLSENIVIVTDRFHELRARMWAEKSGFVNIYAACCETRPYLVIGYWFREMFGLARLYVFGY